MVSRLFWLSMGVTMGVLVVRKLSRTAQQFTPGGIAEQVGGTVGELRGALHGFVGDVRTAMNEREGELRAGAGIDGRLGAKPEDF